MFDPATDFPLQGALEALGLTVDPDSPEALDAEEALGTLVEAICVDVDDAADLAARLRSGFVGIDREYVQVQVLAPDAVQVWDTRPEGLVAILSRGPYQPVDADGNAVGDPETCWHVSEPAGIDTRAVAWIGGEA